jgi:NAD(P)H-nitrite reductase large subunit
MGTTDGPDEVLRWESGSALRSVYLRNDTIIGAQLAGNIQAAGVYRSLMLRRADVSSFGRGLVEPGFSMGSVVWDALVAS